MILAVETAYHRRLWARFTNAENDLPHCNMARHISAILSFYIRVTKHQQNPPVILRCKSLYNTQSVDLTRAPDTVSLPVIGAELNAKRLDSMLSIERSFFPGPKPQAKAAEACWSP